MLLAFLLPLAHAGQIALGVGAAAGGGSVGDVSYTTAAPMVSASYMAHILLLEGWGGASSSLLLGGNGQGDSYLAAPFQLELGVGLGGKGLGFGVFASRGISGAGGGLYGHATLKSDGWLKRVGVEGRLASYEGGTSALELLVRFEPDPRHHRDEERRPPEPAYPPEAAPVAPPPEDDAGGTHHDDPYEV